MKSFINSSYIMSALMCLLAFSSIAQDSLVQVRSAEAIGGRWYSAGNLTSFATVGQLGVATHLGNDSTNWSGSVGFIGPIFDLGTNRAPIAIASPFPTPLNLDDVVVLEGFDPDGDSIVFEIVEQPSTGSLTRVEGTLADYVFVPNSGLSPDELYLDSLVFKVVETGGRKQSSELANYTFQFQVEDVVHDIIDISFSGTNLIIDWEDIVANKSYGVEVLYYDLSDLANADFVELYSESNPASSYSDGNGIFSLDLGINSDTHPYIFDGDKVLVTVVITTPNGGSDFDTYVIDNTQGGRIDASEDGEFFAFAGDMTVAENKQVSLNLVAVDLGTQGLENATLEIIGSAAQGNISIPSLKETATNTKTWLMEYTSTEQVGGVDSIQFRVYHPERQLFDTAWAKVTIKDVNDAPRIKRLADQRTDEGVALVLDLEYSDPDNEVSILVESNEKTLVPVTYADGKISINPDNDFSGRVSINVIVTELGTAESYVAFDRFDLEVIAVNDPPVVASVSNKVILEDSQLNLVLSATDVDAALPVFDYSALISDPSKFDITIDGNNVSIIPAANVNGSFEVKLFADDRLGTATSKSEAEIFTLDITPVNDPPTVLKQIPSQTIVVGLPAYDINLQGFFTDVETPESLTYTAQGNVNVELTFANGVMTVNPTANLNGVEDVIITASDEESSVSQQVAFVAAAVNNDVQVVAPIALEDKLEDFGTFTIDASVVFEDQNNANTVFTYELIGGAFLEASIDVNTGIITVKSSPEFSGTEKFFLIASVNGQSTYTSFDIKVNPVNDAPKLVTPENQIAQEDIGLSDLFVEVSDIDNEFSELSISAVSSNTDVIPTESILFTASQSGYLMSFTSVENKSGLVNITVSLSDGEASVESTFSVDVQPINDKPIQVVTNINAVNEDDNFLFDVTEVFTDIENDDLTLTLIEKPNWAIFQDQLISGKPSNDDVGTWVITVNANDGNGGELTASFAFDVNNVNDAPTLVAELDDITVFQENVWNFNFPNSIFQDIDAGDELTYSFETFPSWATVSGNSLTGTPGYDDIGSYDLVMKATDGSGESVSESVKVNVEFTLYPAIVSVNAPDACSNGKYTVSATGAVSYNWYNSEGALIGANQSELTLDPGTYQVEGLDSEGRATPDKVTFELEKCTVLEIVPGVSISVYPNPAVDVMHISGVNEGFEYEVFDALGRRHPIASVRSGNTISLYVSTLTDGMYFIKYSIDGKDKVKKFIKSR
ncbi:MAG: T9SS type A sorting domain-containing protein [Cyclobacteriaceae bacterium]